MNGGSPTIEYVLLLAVVVALASTVFKSKLFQEVFGRDSDFMAALIVRMEYAYRHGRMETRTIGTISNTPLSTTRRRASPVFLPPPRPTPRGEPMVEKNCESGQSTIEFLLIFVFILGFVFSALKLSFIYTNGYLVHYATFMASRAYMVVDINSHTPEVPKGVPGGKRLKFSGAFPLDKFIRGYDQNLQFNEPDGNGQNFDRNLYVGVYTDFTQRFWIVSICRRTKRGQFSE